MQAEKKYIALKGEKAHYYEIESRGERAHFYGGNSFYYGVYTPFLSQLTGKYQLASLALRACWEQIGPRKTQVKWETYADDLIAFLEQNYSEPIVGIGHSQGANATVVAAAKRPDLFKSLYLFEPASFTPLEEMGIKLVPYAIKKYVEPFRSALKKPTSWESKEAYFDFLKENKAYRRIQENNLKILASNNLKETKGGKYTQRFPLDWEVANYALPTCLDKHLASLKMPFKIILGKPSIFVSQKVRNNWKRLSLGEHMITNIDFGHLIPLEAPVYCANILL